MSNPLGPGILTLGESGTLKQFAGHCTDAALEPSYSDGDVLDLLDGSQERDEDEETWALTGSLRQELTAPSAIEDWCLDNAGKTVPFVYTPNDEVAKKYSGTVRVRAVKIGGKVKKKNMSDFSFPLEGRPARGA